MKILIVILGKKKRRSAKYYIEYVQHMVAAGFEVVCLTYEGDSIIERVPSEVVCTSIKDFGKWDPLAVWKLKKEISIVKPDIVITHGYRAVTLFNKSNFNIPILSVCYDSNIKHILDSDKAVVSTKSLRLYLVKNGKDPLDIYYVPNSVSIKVDTKNQSYKQPREVPVIGVIGRLKKKNGLNVFIKSLGILRARGVKFRARIAGDGAEIENLKKLAVDAIVDDLVEFSGWVSSREEFIKGVDIVCLPTLRSNTYNTILEAFICSKPVIATSVSGHNEVLIAGENALIVPEGEPEPLAVACEQLIRNPDIALSIAKAGYRTATQEYSEDKARAALVSAIKSITEGEDDGCNI